MARTKKQAKARQAGSAHKSTAANDGGESRVYTTTGGAEGGDEASSASSSERARRADRREKAMRTMAEATSTRDADIQSQATTATADAKERQQGDFHMTPAPGGAVSENYCTTLEGLGEDACTEDSRGGGLYNTPSIKSPLKTGQEKQRGRQTQRGRSGRQLSGARRGAETKERRGATSATADDKERQ